MFQCINIKSFRITETEAKLLNEINTLHCDGYYGDRFTTNDVVICLDDVHRAHLFLETSKKIFVHGLDKCDFLGFIEISGKSTVMPYIIKESTKLNNQDTATTQSKSSITSSLSNLSIKRPINDQNSDKNSILMSNDELNDLRDDELNCLLMNEEDDLNTIRIDSSNETFNENSLTEFDENNLENQFDHDFDQQINSNNFLDSSDHQIDSNLINNLVNGLDENLNSSETDQFNSQPFGDAFKSDTSYQSTNPQFDCTPTKKRFVPCAFVENSLIINKAEKMELTEWDCSYLRMICIYGSFKSISESLLALSTALSAATNNGNLVNSDSNKLKMVCLNEIKWNSQFETITMKDFYPTPCTPLSSLNQFSQTIINQSQPTMNNYLTSNVHQIAHLNKKSHHHYNQSGHQTSAYIHPKKLNNHLATKEHIDLEDLLYHKVSPSNNNNSYVNNPIDQTTTTNLSMHLGYNSTSNLGDNLNSDLNSNLNSNLNNNLNSNLYQTTSNNYQFRPQQHVNNSYSRDNRLSSTQLSNHQPIAHQSVNNLQQSAKSNYHLSYPNNNLNSNLNNNKTNYGSSSSNSQLNKTHYHGTNLVHELNKQLQHNGTGLNSLTNLNSLSSHLINNRNILNNCNSSNQNLNQSNLGTGNFVYDNLTMNSIDNSLNNNPNSIMNSNLSANRINNLSMINNLGLQSTFSYQSLNDSSSFNVSTTTLDNVQLNCINLKPSSSVQALLLSEIEQKLFNQIGMAPLKLVLTNTFNLKLYDCSR